MESQASHSLKYFVFLIFLKNVYNPSNSYGFNTCSLKMNEHVVLHVFGNTMTFHLHRDCYLLVINFQLNSSVVENSLYDASSLKTLLRLAVWPSKWLLLVTVL